MRVRLHTTYIPEDDYDLSLSEYPNKRTALVLRTLDGEPMAVLSVNLPANPMTDHEIAIKDYSENDGVLAALMEANIVEEPHRFIASGHVVIPVCRKTEAFQRLHTIAESDQ
jgi:hypothetical protein